MRYLLAVSVAVAMFALPASGQVRVIFPDVDGRLVLDPIEPLPVVVNPVVVEPVVVEPVVPVPVFPTPRIPVQILPQVPNPAVSPGASSFGVPVGLSRVDQLVRELGLNPFDPTERELGLVVLAQRGLLLAP